MATTASHIRVGTYSTKWCFNFSSLSRVHFVTLLLSFSSRRLVRYALKIIIYHRAFRIHPYRKLGRSNRFRICETILKNFNFEAFHLESHVHAFRFLQTFIRIDIKIISTRSVEIASLTRKPFANQSRINAFISTSFTRRSFTCDTSKLFGLC